MLAIAESRYLFKFHYGTDYYRYSTTIYAK